METSTPGRSAIEQAARAVVLDRGLRVEFEQGLRLIRALYQDKDAFHLLAVTEKGAESIYRPEIREKMAQSRTGRMYRLARTGWESPGFRFLDRLNAHIRSFIAKWNEDEKLQVAMSVGVFEPGQPKDAQFCVGLSALAIDIDPKDFDRLVPGAQVPEQVIPEVLRRLGVHGLAPHAVVHSGRGLHVYLLLDRHVLRTSDDRAKAKAVWWRLGHLLGGLDRHDLSSMMRVPGTINWKGGSPKPVRFIEEFTDLNRSRYSFKSVAAALEGLPPMPRLQARRGARRSTPRGGQPNNARWAEPPPLAIEDQQMLYVALSLEKPLADLRAATRAMKTKDRSKADFAYACALLEAGLPESVIVHELHAGQKATEHEDPDWYVEHTFQRAVALVWPAGSRGETAPWSVFPSSRGVLYTPVSSPLLSSCATLAAPIASKVKIVLARAGDGKTRSLVEDRARSRWMAGDRTALVGLFVRELLRHEYAINTLFPYGFSCTRDGEMVVERADELPRTHQELFALLPAEVKRYWSFEKLRERVQDPSAFYVNCRHPRVLDERLQYEEQPDGTWNLPSWVSSWESDAPELHLPMAVVKFRGRADLCLMGLSAEVLAGPTPPCSSTCPMTACRANSRTSDSERGAKTFWPEIAFPLLSHRAYSTQVLFKPEANDYTQVVFDELPAFVYRCPKLSVRRIGGRKGRTLWQVEPLDTVESVFTVLAENLGVVERAKVAEADLDQLPSIMERLARVRTNLVMLANKRLRFVKEGRAVSFERMADTRPPFLSKADFEVLLRLSRLKVPEATEVGVDVDREVRHLTNALETMRDFCGDEAQMHVYLEHGFKKHGEGTLWMYRPTDGWDDALLDAQGREREVVLLDATAGLDPRYHLRGQCLLEQMPGGFFPNTSVVLTKSMSKTKLARMQESEIGDAIVQNIAPYRDRIGAEGRGGLLVVLPMEMEKKLMPYIQAHISAGDLPERTVLAHFGALRGRNDFDDFDAVYFTNPYRYAEAYYVGLGLLLHGGQNFPRQWESKNAWEDFAAIRARSVVSDLYQDAMRIGIRRDPARSAFIFVPSQEAAYVVRLMRLFCGATFIMPDCTNVDLSPSPQQSSVDAVL
ncbi:hypothetical protein D7Y11_08655 [Corallococcus sp. AB018]|uniref:hypothetical protein n=1 Tax=Corallococcus sp. AB018 TaxID=2316715 RepID=UPI000F898F40|nr:hypothetical protein [Corallococcus sp. AB018]RUO93604.1 hypothetical protein D7Y11_08655 [Corallococcus sp. AB018]